MKKFFFTAPFLLTLSVLSITPNLEAAGCNSHKNKKVQVECSLSDDNCDDLKSDKKFNKVDA